jgi:hypothetical protein
MIQFNVLLAVFLLFFSVCSLLRWQLARLNVSHLRRYGRAVPEVFAGEIDGETLAKMIDYTIASSRFGSFESIFGDAILVVVLLSGFLPWLAGAVSAWKVPFILAGLL